MSEEAIAGRRVGCMRPRFPTTVRHMAYGVIVCDAPPGLLDALAVPLQVGRGLVP